MWQAIVSNRSRPATLSLGTRAGRPGAIGTSTAAEVEELSAPRGAVRPITGVLTILRHQNEGSVRRGTQPTDCVTDDSPRRSREYPLPKEGS